MSRYEIGQISYDPEANLFVFAQSAKVSGFGEAAKSLFISLLNAEGRPLTPEQAVAESKGLFEMDRVDRVYASLIETLRNPDDLPPIFYHIARNKSPVRVVRRFNPSRSQGLLKFQAL